MFKQPELEAVHSLKNEFFLHTLQAVNFDILYETALQWALQALPEEKYFCFDCWYRTFLSTMSICDNSDFFTFYGLHDRDNATCENTQLSAFNAAREICEKHSHNFLTEYLRLNKQEKEKLQAVYPACYVRNRRLLCSYVFSVVSRYGTYIERLPLLAYETDNLYSEQIAQYGYGTIVKQALQQRIVDDICVSLARNVVQGIDLMDAERVHMVLALEHAQRLGLAVGATE